MPFMGVLMILLIVVLALATFVESAYDTQTAWAVVYGTHWFEMFLLLIGINWWGDDQTEVFQPKKDRCLCISPGIYPDPCRSSHYQFYQL